MGATIDKQAVSSQVPHAPGAAGVIAGIWLFFALGFAVRTQAQSAVPVPAQGEARVTTHATGTFEVKLNPAASDTPAEGAPLGRMTIEKQWHGDLDGVSKGEMLTAGSNVKGSAGYVAVERFSGTLHGLTGTFALMHMGVMTRGAPQLTIMVVPDSGTGQLVGLTGTLMINIADGKHSYDLEYSITPH
jgi:hypothetical protein